jgi:beta-glucuronidase
VGSITLNGQKSALQTVKIFLNGKPLELSIKTNTQGIADIKIPAPKDLRLWSPDNPYLYSVKFVAAGDSLTDKIGFRTLETKGNQLLLNGRPIFLSGISLHEEELGSNPGRIMTESAIRTLFTELKSGLNGNYIRLSHYPHSELAIVSPMKWDCCCGVRFPFIGR